MRRHVINFFYILFLILTSSCGFKVLDSGELNNFKILELVVDGNNNRINYKIKNAILKQSNEASINELTIKINTKSNKNVKEKNIKNEITKYEVNLQSNVKVYVMKTNEIYDDTFSSKGNFIVNDKYSTTIDNEKRLIKNLADQITEKIIDSINLKLNDN